MALAAVLQGGGRADIRAAIRAGADPLGAAFARLRAPEDRRKLGAVYTPAHIIRAMLDGALRRAGKARMARVVDPGAGSGRFLLAAARRFPEAALIGVEIDPLAATLLRANLAAAGLAARAAVIEGDYRAIDLPQVEGATLFIGNPPYLRHHGIAPEWKRWYAETAGRFGVKASRLAGLHLHFFLRSLELSHPGDLGCFVTAAEWLDVNYGETLRRLLAGPLGLTALRRIDARALPFDDAVTTAVIIDFAPGTKASTVEMSDAASMEALGDPVNRRVIPRAALGAPRWSQVGRPQSARPTGWVELGELCRVHRGQVTGGNDIWIAGPHSRGLPMRYLIPTITKARELLAASALRDASTLRCVIDLPADPDALDEAVRHFLEWAQARGADRSYIARHRKCWWSVGLKPPAPILCTYMARRPPAFVRNLCGARHINIAHGLYPRAPLDEATLDALAAWLNGHVAQAAGRTYAGGLTKFEPKELERVLVPPLDALSATSGRPAG